MKFRKANLSEEDFDAFYRIKCDDNNVKWSGYDSKPDRDRLKLWFCDQIKSGTREIHFAIVDNVVVGFYYIMPISIGISKQTYIHTYISDISIPLSDNQMSGFEIGYGILSNFSGMGLGTLMIKDALTHTNGKITIAYVSEKNAPSERVLMKNGFVKTDVCDIRMLAYLKEEHLFYYLWIKR